MPSMSACSAVEPGARILHTGSIQAALKAGIAVWLRVASLYRHAIARVNGKVRAWLNDPGLHCRAWRSRRC